MDQYVRKEMNPPGLRLSGPGQPSCEGCLCASAGMADAYSDAMVCRAELREIPVRQDFLCDLYVPADDEEDQA